MARSFLPPPAGRHRNGPVAHTLHSGALGWWSPAAPPLVRLPRAVSRTTARPLGRHRHRPAVVLPEAVTGRPGFTGKRRQAVLARLTPQPEVPADAPEPLTRMLGAMTADRPCARPAAEVASALGPAAPTLPIPAPRVSSPTTAPATVAPDASVAAVAADAPPPTPTRRASAAAALLVAAGTAVAGTWWLADEGAPDRDDARTARPPIAAPPTSSALPFAGVVPEAPARSTAPGTSRAPRTGSSVAGPVTADASPPRRGSAVGGGSGRIPAATSAETRSVVVEDDEEDDNDSGKEKETQGDEKGAGRQRGD